jgi:hypothetical protein
MLSATHVGFLGLKVESRNDLFFQEKSVGLYVGPWMERLALNMPNFGHASSRVLYNMLTGLLSRIIDWQVLLASR